MDALPTIQELLQIAPVATIVMLIVGVGYFVGRKSQDEHIATLKKFLKKFGR